MSATLIEITSLTYRYPNAERNALDDVNLTVAEGDFVGIIGPSGAGKTTLLHALCGVVPHHYSGDFWGAVKVAGMDTIDAGMEALSRVVGCVWGDVDAQMVAATVEDELLFGLENFGVPHGEIEGRLAGALAEVGISDLRGREISSLSGGQKQKVAVAAIVALRPRLLLLDEPTGELDPESSRRIFTLLRELNTNHGITVVVVEQKIMLLCEFARRLAVMDGGKIARFGPTREVLAHDEALIALGVNVPRIVSLHRRLRDEGLTDAPPPLTLDEAAAMLNAIQGGKSHA